MEHYRAVLLLQLFVDMGTCFLIADLARRLVSPRAARFAFLLAALCPFLANYVANALTETWEVFFTVLALDFAMVGLEHYDASLTRGWMRARCRSGHSAAARWRAAAVRDRGISFRASGAAHEREPASSHTWLGQA